MISPRVSVALCTYNGVRYLDEQLRSLSAQTLTPWELVISDDGSTDGTAETVAEFARTAPFPVHFHRQPVNLGVAQNFGAALALCRGEFVALCDQDDSWLPEKLSVCAGFLGAHPQCLALFTDATVVDEHLQPLAHGSSLRERVGLNPEMRAPLLNPATSLRTLTYSFFVTGATLVVRRELLGYALPIPNPLPSLMIHDAWLAVVAAALGGLDFLDQPTVLYRQHAQQQIGVTRERPIEPLTRPPQTRFLKLANDHEILHAALAARVAGRSVPGELEHLQRRGRFFRRRVQLPGPRWQRVRPILDLWRSGDYRLFCRKPLLSAVRDMIY